MRLADLTAQYAHLTLPGVFVAYWYLVVYEIPRYFLSALTLLFSAFHSPRRENAQPYHPGKVSILMPGHNEGAHLRQSVLSLREQSFPGLEIVVVDDGSVDNMRAVGTQLKKEGLIDLFLSTGIRGGKSAALNLGISYCSGDIIVVVDVDTSFDSDAIACLLAYFEDPAVGAVGGNIGVRNANANFLTAFQHLQYLIGISLGRRVTSMLGWLSMLSGAFTAFRADALRSVGGYEVGPGEDADLTEKLRRAGWKLRFAHDALALTDAPTSFRTYVNQQLRWNRSVVRYRVHKYHISFNPLAGHFSPSNFMTALDMMFSGVFMPISFFIYLLLSFQKFGVFFIFIIASLTVFQLFMKFCTVCIAGVLYPGRVTVFDFLILPLFLLFNMYVYRLIAVTAYFEELVLKKSFKDTFVPGRVLKQIDPMLTEQSVR